MSTGYAVLITAKPQLTTEAGRYDACDSGGDGQLCRFRFNAELFFRELAFPDTFELIFVADSKGTVLFEDTPGRRRWRQWLRRSERVYRDSSADITPSIHLLNISDALKSGTSPGWSALSATSARTTLQLAGDSYQVYLQPAVTQGEPLIVGAAVRRSAVVRDALVVDFSFVAVLVFLVILSVFGLPFVKLASLDRRERFRLWDVTWLYLSTILLVALLTVAVWGLDGYWRWNEVADRGLEQLAATLERNFASEVQAVRNQLDEYQSSVEKDSQRTTLRRPARSGQFRPSGGARRQRR